MGQFAARSAGATLVFKRGWVVISDLGQRYPLSTGLEPLTPQWQDNPRAALTGAVQLLAQALERTAG